MDKEIQVCKSPTGCVYSRFRVVSMCAKASDAGYHCLKARMPIHELTECPLKDEKKFTVIYTENDGRVNFTSLKKVITDDIKSVYGFFEDSLLFVFEGWVNQVR